MTVGDLVVTDLDGTLWQLEDAVHPATVAAFENLTRAGVPVIAATGRRRGSAERALRRLGLAPPAVVLNGALGIDLQTQARFHTRCFAPGAALAVLDAFRSVDLDPCIYVDAPTHEVVVSSSPSTHEHHLDTLVGAVVEADLHATAANDTVLMFSLIGLPQPVLAAAAEKIGRLAVVHVDRSLEIAGMATITVAPLGLSKWDGVLAWCRSTNFHPARVIAIGDGPNDVELLSNADIALVPVTAHQAARELADHFIRNPDDGGWAAIADYLSDA